MRQLDRACAGEVQPLTTSRAGSMRELWTRKFLYPGHTFPTAIAPVMVGVGLALRDGVFAATPAILALLAGWLIQFAGVVTDNYVNLAHQPDDAEHPELVDALHRGVITMRGIRLVMIGCYALALVLGFALTVIAGPVVIGIGLASIVASVAYSAGPWALGRAGLADPLFFLFFGTVSVGGTYYVQAASRLQPSSWMDVLSPTVIAVSIPIGALITCILIIDDIRDRGFDAVKGKRTIAVRFGARWSRYEFTALIALSYLAPPWLALGFGFGGWVLLPLLTAPFASGIARAVWVRDSYRELLPMTPRLAMLTVAYSCCLGAGLWLSR